MAALEVITSLRNLLPPRTLLPCTTRRHTTCISPHIRSQSTPQSHSPAGLCAPPPGAPTPFDTLGVTQRYAPGVHQQVTLVSRMWGHIYSLLRPCPRKNSEVRGGVCLQHPDPRSPTTLSCSDHAHCHQHASTVGGWSSNELFFVMVFAEWSSSAAAASGGAPARSAVAL